MADEITESRIILNRRSTIGSTAVVPLMINGAGTQLQVLVPDLATTGDLRVVNIGTTDLGFISYTDSIYRGVTVSFVATAADTVLRFTDGGLEDLRRRD